MIQKQVIVSPAFKRQTSRAILSIILFVLVYFLLLILALGLTALCITGGVLLVLSFPRLITIALGIGLASLGVMVFIFLIKFMFTSNKIDRSGFVEVKLKDEPELFGLIEEIVTKVGTSFPKRVYLSPDVNASVFYDSSFWSMFLPVKKNLNIGMGLVNSTTTSELTGILAHEFGHFSQKTMKVGSYVYNVNQIIYNMLFDNDSYERAIHNWASASGYFSIFVYLAVFILQGVQAILRGMYSLVNKNYLALSREMEFHADEIAVNITGYEPLQNSLLRFDLASSAFNNVIQYYESKISENLASTNIFREQTFVMELLAKDSDIPLKYSLPDVSVEELNKFNKSKLVIKDQWASHPSTEDRVDKMKTVGSKRIATGNGLSTTLFYDPIRSQEEITTKIFEKFEYKETPVKQSFEDFQLEFKQRFDRNTFAKVFNGYYDDKNPIPFDLNEKIVASSGELNDLFNDEKIHLNYTALALQNDIETIKQIAYKTVRLKSFDYDGKKYTQKESNTLIINLQKKLDDLTNIILKQDKDIYSFFTKLEEKSAKPEKLKQLYYNLFKYDQDFDKKNKIIETLNEKLQFISYTNIPEDIISNFRAVKPLEKELKLNIQELMSTIDFDETLNTTIQENLEQYLSKDWQYFAGENYYNQTLDIFFNAINNYAYLLSRGYFLTKKELLDYKVDLLNA